MTKTLEQVKEDFRKRRGDGYDYSLITEENYVDTHHKVQIICKKCGKTFTQTPHEHQRHGCPYCGGTKKLSLEEFIEKAKSKWGNAFDYSYIKEYVNSKTPVEIKCNRCGEFFQQTPNGHLTGNGKCPLCWQKQTPQFGKRKLIYGIGELDVDYAYNVDEITKKAYDHWGNMMMRCYSDAYQKRNPNYIGCTVDKRWHKFSVFLEWFKENYIDGYALDKDLLIPSNKCYSPETCCFLPPKINTMIVARHRKTNRFGKGVSITPKGKYVAFLNRYNKTYNLGHFDTIEEAFNAYKQGKIAYVREVADAYYKEGKITKEVYDALYRYEPKFKD
jgi:predicted  nucleic acid-binding Zn-ribbon protein